MSPTSSDPACHRRTRNSHPQQRLRYPADANLRPPMTEESNIETSSIRSGTFKPTRRNGPFLLMPQRMSSAVSPLATHGPRHGCTHSDRLGPNATYTIIDMGQKNNLLHQLEPRHAGNALNFFGCSRLIGFPEAFLCKLAAWIGTDLNRFWLVASVQGSLLPSSVTPL